MIIEYKRKSGWIPLEFSHSVQSIDWRPVPKSWKAQHINFDAYSIRINKDRQYHTAGTPGFIDSFNKAMSWMMISG